MTKTTFTNIVLGLITGVGFILVAQGIITGEALTEIQNIIGMSLAGGGISLLTIISVFKLIPIKVVNDIYTAAKDKYSEDKINSILDTLIQVPVLVDTIETFSNELKAVKDILLVNRDINLANGVYDELDPNLKDKIISIE